MCKDKAEYEKCVSNKAYFISLMKRAPMETEVDFIEKAFNEDVERYNNYANRWIGNTKINRSTLKKPQSADVFLGPFEAMIVSKNNMPKARENAKTIYGFDGHFTYGEDEETEKLFLNVHPFGGEKSFVIDSFGFGTKEQNALRLCNFLKQIYLPTGEALCPSSFIVSSNLKSDTLTPSIKELVYHLEAIKYRHFDKSNYLRKVEQKEIQRLEKIFRKHQSILAQRE